MIYQVVDEPGQEVSSGVKSTDDKSNDVAKDFIVIPRVVQDWIQQRGLIVVARFSVRLIKKLDIETQRWNQFFASSMPELMAQNNQFLQHGLLPSKDGQFFDHSGFLGQTII